MSVPAVEMIGISKRFGSVEALSAVDLTVGKGETHAVVGENGAGKTTLMRILYGALAADSGTVRVEGRDVRFHRASDGIAAGIGMVSQHYAIIPELTCLQNLMLGAEPGAFLGGVEAESRAQRLAESMGFSFRWHEAARELSPSAAQKLEILKLLWRDSRIMILDEPTAMLSPADSDALFESLQALADQGATILLVTHRLPEVLERCQRVTVLRGGKLVAAKPVAETNAAELAELIVGHAVAPPADLEASPGAPMLSLEGVSVRGARGDEALKAVSLQVRAGEVIGVAGVDGSGQRELFWTIMGILKPHAGRLQFEGEALSGVSPRERIQRGFRLIPEDRHEEGVVDEWSLEENAAIGLQRLDELSTGAWMRREQMEAHAAAVADRFQTRHGGVRLPMGSLSGGNQQRFVAARALSIRPRLVLAFQPARGLDIEATRQVYRGLREAASEGAAVLVVSFDLDELLESCDRVVAMNRGRIQEPPAGQERDRATIGRLMVGAETGSSGGALP